MIQDFLQTYDMVGLPGTDNRQLHVLDIEITYEVSDFLAVCTLSSLLRPASSPAISGS